MKRAGALIVVFLLVSLYITTLICAVIGSDFANSMLQASVFGTIFLPVILYAYLYLFKVFNKQNGPNDDSAQSADNEQNSSLKQEERK